MQSHLIVNLTKEKLQDAEVYGLVFRTDEETEFHTNLNKLPDRGVNLHLDVPLCFENFVFHPSEDDTYILEQYWSLIPIRFFLFAETAHTGVTLWERDPGPPGQSNTPRQFRFQTQLPEDKRAQRHPQGRTSSQPGIHPPATRGESLLDLDWEKSYAESSHWGPIWVATHWEDAEWPEEYQLIKKNSIGALTYVSRKTMPWKLSGGTTF